jgi:hypothetical protein
MSINKNSLLSSEEEIGSIYEYKSNKKKSSMKSESDSELIEISSKHSIKESPIKNEIARKILEDMLYSNKELMDCPILEFRRKKVIKSRVSKFYELFKSQDYNQSLEIINNTEKEFVHKPRIKECKYIKKIRKSPILRRLYNFWNKKSNHYPTCYKILEVVTESGYDKFVEETSDLTKQQFTIEEMKQIFG